MIEDGLRTPSSEAQHSLEQHLISILKDFDGSTADQVGSSLELVRPRHVEYLHEGLRERQHHIALGCSRPWLCYWITHSLALLRASFPSSVPQIDVVNFLRACQAPTGGFGGGPSQLPHLAPTYAAVSTLVTIGEEAALTAIDRVALLAFVRRMCVPPEAGGGIAVSEGGEVDCRGCYTAIASLHMLHLDKEEILERSGMADFISRCQTYEGGLGGEPGNEAHGGYTYCGLAALVLAERVDVLNLPSLLHWAVHRQGLVEGGFMGRTNKLVDGCYSFWQGGLFPLLQRVWPQYLQQSGVPRGPLPQAPIAVPPLPPLSTLGPLEQAQAETARLKASPDSLLQQGIGSMNSDHANAEALLHETADAQRAVNWAQEYEDVVRVSAAVLCSSEDSTPVEPSARGSGGADAQAGNAQLGLQAPLYNTVALRLWLLQCCQNRRGGGLRDKPGTAVDYYHTCYCLSGLAACQAYSGAGPWDALATTDPALNILESKLEVALAYYGKSNISELDSGMDLGT
ncbi:g9217 [Coccomyxa elongata]